MGKGIDLLLLQRLAAAQTPWGRLWLDLHVQRQRLRAFWLTHGAELEKRAFDITVSFILLVALSPLLLLIGAAVWLEDGGPVFFAQTRVGQYGRRFKMFKFRSMCLDAEERLKELLAKNETFRGEFGRRHLVSQRFGKHRRIDFSRYPIVVSNDWWVARAKNPGLHRL